jgi:hypothetical protein
MSTDLSPCLLCRLNFYFYYRLFIITGHGLVFSFVVFRSCLLYLRVLSPELVLVLSFSMPSLVI